MMQRINAGESVRIFFDDAINAEHELSFELERDSSLELAFIMRGMIPKFLVSVRLIGENAQAHIKGLYILHGAHQLVLETKQLHQAAHTVSTCTIKGILYDKSYAQYRGTIYVEPQAHHTIAKQLNKNILLSCQARAQSVPSLEVLTKQVQCSHGSAVGNLDKEVMFYMQARGLSESQAQRILLQGFVSEIMDAMPANMVEQIKELIR